MKKRVITLFTVCRANQEQNDKSCRPEIAEPMESIDSYEVIYLGFPIWWGEEPRIIDTFLESYDFSDKTVIPFCTSGSSGIATSEKNIRNLVPIGNLLEGKRFSNAKANGVTKAEAAAIITHIAFYVGWPKGWAVFKLAMEVWNDKLAAEFATSGSSGFGKTVQNLQSSAADCKIIEGKINPTSNDISAIAKI